MKRLFLVDISSLIFRAFYAVRPLTSPAGLPTNAIYGVLSMLAKLLKEEKPDHLVVCYDRKEPSFRKELYPEYKAHRTEMPEELVPQMPVIKKLVDLLGLPSLEVPTFEADDIIGTLAKMGVKKGYEVFIVSGDKDFGQLICDHMYIYDTMKNQKLGTKEVEEKWGVPPAKFLDYLALVGDSSDNIPGVRGIGPKGAQALLHEYHTIDGIYENLGKIKSESTRKKLTDCKDMAYLSRQLAEIRTDVEVPSDFELYRPRGFVQNELRELLRELNFKTYEKSLFEDTGTSGAPTSVYPEATAVIATKKTTSSMPALPVEISELASHLKPKTAVWFYSGPRGIFLSDEAKVFELQGDPAELGRIGGKLGLRWKGHDLKSFWHQIRISNPVGEWDSMLAAYALRPGESTEFEKVYAWMMGGPLGELPSSSDWIEFQMDLRLRLQVELTRTQVEKIYKEFELPVAEILYEMECNGIKIDRTLLDAQGKELEKEIRTLEVTIHEMAGTQFNIGSPKQLSQVLFDKLKLTSFKKTKTGFSTDNEVLEKLSKEHPIAEQLLKYRELTKLKSTYVDSLPNLLKEDGRIHTTFNQALTATGRLSSTDPNLQNIPIKTERGARVRKAFVADRGHSLLSVDYSQIELRILAHYSSDPNLIRAFEEDLDIHTATASEVFSVELKSVTPEMRRAAKAINFGIAYGQGAFGLAESLKIPRGEAQEIIKRYFTRFSRVKDYIEETIEKAKAQGYVETIYGRRRYIDELKSSNVMIRKFGERAAINAPIQGSASDIVKKAMIDVHRYTTLAMLLQVHDELVFEGPHLVVQNEAPQIVKIMEHVTQMKIPLKANAAIGPNWDEAH